MHLTKRLMIAIVIVVAIIVAGSSFAYWAMNGYSGKSTTGDGKPTPVHADAGPDVFGTAGQPVKFNASLSTGPITTYWWDFNRVNVTDPLKHEGEGKTVEHVYEDPGVFLVTLVVEGKGGVNSTDTVSAYISYNETQTGTVSPTHVNETYAWHVSDGISKVKLTLKFPTRNGSGLPLNNVDIFVYVGDETTPDYNTVSQVPNPNNDPTTKTLDVPIGQIVTAGSFRVEVRWISSEVTSRNIAFELLTELQYLP